jgi:hypothetical protein
MEGRFMKFLVEIVEKIAMSVEVEAPTEEEALAQIEKRYWNEEIIVESDKGVDVSFRVYSE